MMYVYRHCHANTPGSKSERSVSVLYLHPVTEQFPVFMCRPPFLLGAKHRAHHIVQGSEDADARRGGENFMLR
jgi:hypothetical protein